MTRYVATVNTPGYLPESEPVEFDSATEAWRYLIDELDRDGRAYRPADPADPEGPQDATEARLSMERMTGVGTVYAPCIDDACTHLDLAYSVDYAPDCRHSWVAGMMYVSDEDLDAVSAMREVTCENCDAVYGR